MARTALTSLWLGLPLLVAANASAEELPESVWLSVEDCSQPTLKLAEAYAALRLELSQAGMRVVRDNEREQARAELTVQLRCGPGIRATLHLRQHQERSSASRVVSLDDASSKDRARVLALALTELVRSDWADLSRPVDGSSAAEAAEPSSPSAIQQPARNEAKATSTPSKATEPAQAEIKDDGPAPSSPAVADNAWHWRADALVRWFTASPGLTLGPAFALSRGRFSAGLEAALGRGSDPRGVANYGFGAATLGLDAYAAQGRVVRFTVGPRAALGATWMTGQGATANVQGSNVVQLYADARLEGALALQARAIDVGVRLCGGRANGLRLRDRAETLGATGGWFVGATLGAGW